MAERRRPPWWMYAVLASCAAYVLSVWWVHVTGPESPGLTLNEASPGMLVDAVQPGSAGQRSGLQDGDVLVSVNGKTGRAGYIDLFFLTAAGRPYELEIDRHGQRRAVTLSLGRKSASAWARGVSPTSPTSPSPSSAPSWRGFSLCVARTTRPRA